LKRIILFYSNFLERAKNIINDMGITENLKAHSFRKHFSSQIRDSNLDREFTEHLMGHKGQNLTESYNQNLMDINWFYRKWLKAEILICIDCEIIDKTNEEINELKEQMIKKEQQIDLLLKAKIEQNGEINILKQTVESLLNDVKTLLNDREVLLYDRKGIFPKPKK